MSLAKKALSGALWMSGINYLGFALNFAIQIALIHLLVPEDFGIFALGYSFADILLIFFGFSFSMALIQIRDADDLFDTALYLSLIFGAAIVIVGGLGSLILSRFYPLSSILAFVVLCLLQPLQNSSSIYSAAMEKDFQFRNYAVTRLLATNISGVFAIGLAWAGLGFWSLVIREAITGLLMFLGLRALSRYRFTGKFNRATAGRLLSYGFRMLTSRSLEIAYHRIPNFFIGTFAGVRELGLFSQTAYLVNLPATMLNPINQSVSFATYAQLQNDRERLSKAFQLPNYFIIRILCLLLLLLVAFPGQILGMLYGPKWLDAATMLRYFGLFAAVLPLFINTKTLLYSLNRIGSVSIAYLIALAVLSCHLAAALIFQSLILVPLGYSLSLLASIIFTFSALSRRDIALAPVKLLAVPSMATGLILGIWFLVSGSQYPWMPHFSASMPVMALMLAAFSAFIAFFERNEIKESGQYILHKLFIEGKLKERK